MKKLIALFLTFVMLATTVLAAVPVGAENSDASVETGNDNLTVEGTNGFGNLLSEDILESQEESGEEYKEGYTVTDLVIEGNTAIVTYDSLEAANLVVALYTEDMVQMICSANTVVDPESTTATVTFGGDMPQYFMAAAYLMDTYDMSPLCPMYDTPLYTKDMQDLLNSTVNDYDEELILNLDENEETNFAVYSEETVVIEGDENTNIVAFIDDENLTYVIENTDDTVKSLAKGSVFVYPYGENEILIAKVDEIAVYGDTVTIKGTDLEMEDVFSHVKIEGESYTSDIEVDTSTADEGVTYNGLVSEGPAARSWEGGGNVDVSLSFEFEKELKSESDHLDLAASIKGSLDLKISASISYYISLAKQYIELTVTPTAQAQISVTASIDCKLPLGALGFSPVPGVYIGFEPDLVFRVEGTIETSITFSTTFGIGFYSDTGVKNLTTVPTVDVNLKAEITIFFGIDFNPKITIIGDKVAKLELNTVVGVELTAESQGKYFGASTASANSRHGCNSCIKMDLKFKAELTGKIIFLNLDWLSVSVEIGKFTLPIGDMYWSEDNREFGWGTCPNVEYKVTVTARDDEKNAKKDIELTLSDGQSEVTNKNGSAVFYLTKGSYTVSADFGDKTAEKKFSVKDESKKVTIYENDSLNPSDDKTQNTANRVQKEQSKDDYLNGSVVPEKLYYSINNGKVTINGYGGEEPNLIIPARIEGCPVTAINNYAFQGNYTLVSVTIPDGVTAIPIGAFYRCEYLESVTLPESLTSIGYRGFAYCSNLKSINVPDSVTSIGDSAFYQCYSLESINIPAGITSIGEAVYERCGDLKSVIIPDSVTSIGPAAFYYCVGLTNITIPASVESIGSSAFQYCENLRSITFTGDAPSINNTAFGTSWGYGAIITTAYYPANNPTWTANVMQDYGGNITWTPYYGAAPVSMDDGDITIMSADVNDGISVMSVYPGEYETEITPDYTLNTASFEGLVPRKDYVLLVLADMGAEDTLSSENLLYIGQGVAMDDGTLTFKYVPKSDVDASYVIACGPSNKNLKDAEISFPEMEADGELNTVEPTVVYDGVTLTEGVNYVIVGTVSYRVRGTYTCYIRGIYDYTGTVKCTYTVDGDFLPGDIDSDGRLTAMDSNLLKRMVAGSTSADGILAADVNGDGTVNAIDSNILRRTIAGQ